MAEQRITSTHERLPYVAALDGLRGLFVLAVVLAHMQVPFMQGGGLGVGGFFVLSGFLITTILLREHTTTGRIDLPGFYFRRARRLLPALCAMLLLVGAFIFVNSPTQNAIESNWRGIWSALLYVSNWAGMNPDGLAVNMGAFQHTWSLSIEEQFYMAWPLCLILVMRYRPRSLLPVLTSLIALSLAARFGLILLGTAPTDWRLYAGTDTRADELFIGCLLAALLWRGAFRPSVKLTRAAACLSVVGLLAMVALASHENHLLHVGGLTLVALLVAAIILHLRVSPQGRLARLLSVRPLVKVGVVSYGIYLWHTPVFVLMPASTWADWPVRLLAVAITAAAVILSYRYIERPFMRLKPPSVHRSSAAVLRAGPESPAA